MATGYAGDAMGLGEAMIVAGIGCRKGASAEEIGAALDTALERAGRPLARIELLATAERKREEEGIAAAAAARGLRLVFVEPGRSRNRIRARRDMVEARAGACRRAVGRRSRGARRLRA